METTDRKRGIIKNVDLMEISERLHGDAAVSRRLAAMGKKADINESPEKSMLNGREVSDGFSGEVNGRYTKSSESGPSSALGTGQKGVVPVGGR